MQGNTQSALHLLYHSRQLNMYEPDVIMLISDQGFSTLCYQQEMPTLFQASSA